MQNPNQLERLVWSGDQTGNRGDYQFVSAPRPLGVHPVEITVDGAAVPAEAGEWLIDSILRVQELAHVCYHPQMGPIQSCDTCMVEVDGELVRACGMKAAAGQTVVTRSARAQAAQKEASTGCWGITCSTARSATTTTATARCTTRRHCSMSSTRGASVQTETLPLRFYEPLLPL